ncbi:MAG TPA: hypothetical protein VF070_34070 [Streptosporangiaceae bacterium]
MEQGIRLVAMSSFHRWGLAPHHGTTDSDAIRSAFGEITSLALIWHFMVGVTGFEPATSSPRTRPVVPGHLRREVSSQVRPYVA